MTQFTVKIALPRGAVAGAALVCVLASFTACTGHASDGSTNGSSTTTPAGQTDLTAAEIQYGVSPTRNDQVTYQDDVIVMEHGAEAIRSQAANGLTWTIDGNAAGAQEIQPDKILFATGRVVGRVLAVEHQAGDIAVTLGPIELTDVIKDAKITYHGALDLEKMITYVAPEQPGTSTDLDAADQSSAARRSGEPSMRVVTWSPIREDVLQSVRRSAARDSWPAPRHGDRTAVRGRAAAYEDSAMNGAPIARGTGVPADLAIGGFHFLPDITKGLGFSATHTAPGITFTAFAKLTLDNPNFTFRLDITGGHLKTAEVQLSGLAAVRVGFDGGTNADFKNPNQAFELPLDTSFPIPGIPVPFAATFHQSILVQTMFTARNATFHAAGKYGLGGTITAGVIDGHLGATAPVFIDTKQNLAESLNGASLGVNGLVLGYGGKFLIGLGAYSFAVGPYLSVNTTVGATRGSDLQGPITGYTCRSAQYDMALDYGVGYAIPNIVVKALNTFLSLFHAKPITATHGTSLGTIPIKTDSQTVPPGCGGGKAT
jgi:hypothetical protein